MAQKVIVVSELSGREIDEHEAVTVTVSFADGRSSNGVVDANPDDAEVKHLISVGTKIARRRATGPRKAVR